MTEYKRYPEYKDSGVEWLGEVPSHWSLPNTGRVLSQKKEIVGELSSEYSLLSLTTRGVIVRDVASGFGKFPASFDSYQVVYPDDLVFCLFDSEETPRTVGLVHEKGMITGAYTRFHIDNSMALSKYLEYYFISIDDKKGFRPLYTGLRKTIQKPRLLASKLPLPSLETQQRIVEFLDRETAHIDAGVANMESLIALLSEKRAALISETVTRGIPGEYTEFKDSEVPWLGEIPIEWQLVPGKKVVSTHKEIVGDQHENYQRLSLTMEGVLPKSKTTADGLSPESFSTYQILRPGEFVFKMIDLENRKTSRVGLSHDTGLVSSAYIVATPKAELDKNFGYYYYTALYNEGIYNFLGSGVRSTLNADDMKEIPVCLPPLETQQKIVEFLDRETVHLDKAVLHAKALIQLMKEKRQTLISEVVTGKIDVTGEVN